MQWEGTPLEGNHDPPVSFANDSSVYITGGCHSHRLYSHSCDRTQSTANGQTIRISAVNGQSGVGQRSNPSAERTRLVLQFAPNLAVSYTCTERLFPNIQARWLGLQFKYRDFFAGKYPSGQRSMAKN